VRSSSSTRVKKNIKNKKIKNIEPKFDDGWINTLQPYQPSSSPHCQNPSPKHHPSEPMVSPHPTTTSTQALTFWQTPNPPTPFVRTQQKKKKKKGKSSQ
jgi:hypothetical protein